MPPQGKVERNLTDDEDDFVIVHTDGSCQRRAHVKNGPMEGGWAFVARFGLNTIERWGFDPNTTNQEMELMAIQKALASINLSPQTMKIVTDSKYAIGCLTDWWHQWILQGWHTSTGNPVANLEVIQDTLELLKAHEKVRTVLWGWVKGHKGNIDNERADMLAHDVRVHKLMWMPPRPVVRRRRR